MENWIITSIVKTDKNILHDMKYLNATISVSFTLKLHKIAFLKGIDTNISLKKLLKGKEK